jgi:hypothetical protein
MFKFNIGKKKAAISTIIVLTFIVASLSSCLKIEEKYIWDVIYEYLQTHNPDSPLLPELRKDPGIVQRDVERTVDSAIRRVTPEYDRIIAEADAKYKPRYMDETNDERVCYTDECKKLAPPMRLCAPWLDNCPHQ